MKKIDLGQALGIIANVGVLVGILLLVYELAQNREMMEAQTRNDLYNGLASYLAMTGDPEILDITQKNNRGEQLSEMESARLRSLRQIQFRYFENLHYQYRKGLFDEVEFSAQRNIWRNLFSEKLRVDQWCEARAGFSPEFVDEIENLLTTYQC